MRPQPCLLFLSASLCVASLAVLPAWAAETQRVEDLGPILEEIRKKHDLPALGGAIVHGDKVVAIGAAGVRKQGAKAAVTTRDLWHLGSCTKAMTSVLIAKLVEERRLSWDLTLERAFPELGRKMLPAYRKVTLEQLLRHRGGIIDKLTSDPVLWRKLRQYRGPLPAIRKTLVQAVLKKPPVAKPGTKHVYSNAGYIIAGAIAEKVTGRPSEELMRQRIFRPLGMRGVGFGAPGTTNKLVQPWGHLPRSGEKPMPVPPGPRGDNPAALGPAGTVHATLEDWARFVSLHLRKGDGKKSFLKAKTLNRLHTPSVG